MPLRTVLLDYKNNWLSKDSSFLNFDLSSYFHLLLKYKYRFIQRVVGLTKTPEVQGMHCWMVTTFMYYSDF